MEFLDNPETYRQYDPAEYAAAPARYPDYVPEYLAAGFQFLSPCRLPPG
jgi:hypothetical protein